MTQRQPVDELERRYGFRKSEVINGTAVNEKDFAIVTLFYKDSGPIHQVFKLTPLAKDGTQEIDRSALVGSYSDDAFGFDTLGVAIRAGRFGNESAMQFGESYVKKTTRHRKSNQRKRMTWSLKRLTSNSQLKRRETKEQSDGRI